MTTTFKIDEKAVLKLAKILNTTNLEEIEYESEAGRVRVSRGRGSGMLPSLAAVAAAPTAAVAQAAAPKAEGPEPTQPKDLSQHPGVVKSPIVATAYRSSSPDAAPFVKEGDKVKEGQTLLILEAMKVMNPLKSPRAGTVTKILVDDGTPVEFGEALLIIE